MELSPILAELGYSSHLVPIPREKRDALDLPVELSDARLAIGNGSLRGIVCEVSEAADLRTVLSTTAARLSSRAPRLLWLIAAVQKSTGRLGLAVFDASRSRPRVAALIIDRGDLVDSDCETLCAMAGVHDASDAFRYSRWLQILGRDSVNRRFFRELERLVGQLSSSLQPMPKEAIAAELALLYVSRLLFLSFVETKGWLDRDHGFLANRYADCMLTGGGYHRRVLRPLFFGTLNTHPSKRAQRARDFGRVPFLNGGLFARSSLEANTARSTFSDEALGDLFGDLLSRYRFTAREDGATWTEAAIDPEMLGKAFESLMSSRSRKTSGAFYTPQSMVRDVVAAGFRSVLPASKTMAPEEALRLVGDIRVIDPACGSGAFLIHALEELSRMRQTLGDTRQIHSIRRELLTRSIFGVDVNPTAVWLCELRLWLSMAIEDPETDPLRVAALPNLDRNIRVGDSLSGDSFDEVAPRNEGRRISMARARYARATGPKKRSLGRSLDSMERKYAICAHEAKLHGLSHARRELLNSLRSRDLFGERKYPGSYEASTLDGIRTAIRDCRRKIARLKSGGAMPFSFAAHFADVAARAGFDLVIGNPPWIRVHNLERQTREELRSRFVVYQSAGWNAGLEASGAGKGFGSQIDASALFIERSIGLMREGGVISLVVPSKLWHSLAGGGVRRLLLERTEISELHDLTHAPQVFDAAVYPSVIVAKRKRRELEPVERCVRIETAGPAGERRFAIDRTSLPFDASPGSPWITVPAEVRHAFDAIRNAGVPLSESSLGRPLLGVKTGFNDAFILSSEQALDSCVEPHMLRPSLRGDAIQRWSIRTAGDLIVWTHDASGALTALPVGARRWLQNWQSELERRSDLRHTDRWWRLFRTESGDHSRARVVWADIGRSPRAAVVSAGDPTIPLNTCYVIPCKSEDDAHALTALLNSPLVDAWLALIAEPARGGYRRYFGWTMSLLPIPREWDRARQTLAPLSRSATKGNPPGNEELHAATLDAYGVEQQEIESLLKWIV